MKSGFKVFAPASVSISLFNSEIISFCLDQPGVTIIGRFCDTPGLRISKFSGSYLEFSFNPQNNPAVICASELFEFLNETLSTTGIELEIQIHSSLDDSSIHICCAVATALAINELFHRPLDKNELIPFVISGAQSFLDFDPSCKILSSLIGGIHLIREHSPLDYCRLPSPNGLFISAIFNNFIRNISHYKISNNPITPTLNRSQFEISFAKNLGSLIVGLYNSNFELIQKSITGLLYFPDPSSPFDLSRLNDIAHKNGAWGCLVSGSSIFTICQNSITAENAGQLLKIELDRMTGTPSELFISSVSNSGAFIF